MYLRLTPIKLTLYGLVTLEIPFFDITKVLFQKKIWHYETPTIRKKLIDCHKQEEDKTPPQINSVIYVKWIKVFIVLRNVKENIHHFTIGKGSYTESNNFIKDSSGVFLLFS